MQYIYECYNKQLPQQLILCRYPWQRMGMHAGVGEYVFSTKGLATGLS